MKNIGLSILAILALSNVSFAGGKGVIEAAEPMIVIPDIEEEESVSGFYAGLGLSAVSTRELSVDFSNLENGEDRVGKVSLVAGYDFNEYVAVEGRYMLSVGDEDVLDRTSWGVFLKPQYPVTEDFKVYGLLGYGGFTMVGTNSNQDITNVEHTGLQWGLGASYEVYKNISIFIDYLKIDGEVDTPEFATPSIDISSDIITVGITYHF